MMKRLLDQYESQDYEQDDVKRCVRPKNISYDTEASESWPPRITLEDSPTMCPSIVTKTLASTSTAAPVAVVTFAEHQTPAKISLRQSISPPISPALFPMQAASGLETVRKRVFERENDWRHGGHDCYFNQDGGSRNAALDQKQSNWRSSSPPLPPLELREYGKDLPHLPKPESTQPLGFDRRGEYEKLSQFHLSHRSPEYDKGPTDHAHIVPPGSAYPDDCPDICNAPGPIDPRLAAHTQLRGDLLVESRGKDIPATSQARGQDAFVIPQSNDPLPVAPQRQLPIEDSILHYRWKDAVSPQDQVQDEDLGPRQFETGDDKGPVLLQFPVGDGCFATISMRVERSTKAGARHPPPAIVHHKTDYVGITPNRLGHLVSEIVADEKQRLCK